MSDAPVLNRDDPSGSCVTSSQRRRMDRSAQIAGKLTTTRLSELFPTDPRGKVRFIRNGTWRVFCASESQFTALSGKMRSEFPLLTLDCCQSFSTVSAVLLSSMHAASLVQLCSNKAHMDYLLYLSAWLHQYTMPCWPSRGARPTVGDLDSTLFLAKYFAPTVAATDFHALYYNQEHKCRDLIEQMFVSRRHSSTEASATSSFTAAPPSASAKLFFPRPFKAPRQEGAARATEVAPTVHSPLTCGYIIVSGEYTISIFAVEHETSGAGTADSRWTCCLCDSHGTIPLSGGMASVSAITFGGASNSDLHVLSRGDGMHYLWVTLAAVLERHRESNRKQPGAVPYMTWTPIRRDPSLEPVTFEQLKAVIDKEWLPKVLSNAKVRARYEESKAKYLLKSFAFPAYVSRDSSEERPQGGARV